MMIDRDVAEKRYENKVGMHVKSLTGVLKISLAGANNLVPTTGLTPCIIIVHVYTCNYSGTEKKHRRPLAFPGTVNGVIAPILHP